MSLIAVTTSQGLSVILSSALQASHPNPAPLFTTTLTPPSRIPSSCISWSYDASTLFVASGGSVSAYDPSSGAWLRDVIREGEGGIGGAKLGAMVVLDGPDESGLMLALAKGPRAVLFDAEARRAVLTIEGHKSSIQTMSAACDQSLLATSSTDATMITNISQQSTTVLRGAPAGATTAAFHPSRRTTLLILSPKGLHVFDTAKGGAPIRTIPIKVEGTGGSIAFSPSTSSLVAVALPGRDGRVVLLDIDKDSSLLKKFNVDENVTAMSFSHDGATIIVTSETGRVMQLNLRGTDAPGQAVTVDPVGGRIGGMALVAESSTASNTLPRARPVRTDSLPNMPTTDSLRNKAPLPDLRVGTLRKRPSILDTSPRSPDSPRISSPETLRNRSPQLSRSKPSVIDLHKKSSVADLKSKTSPGALRIKAGVENKVRPTSMITAGTGKERVRVRPVSLLESQSDGEGLTKATRDTISRATKPSLADLKLATGTPSPGSKVSSANVSPLTKGDRRPTISPTSRRQTQTMPRRLTSEGSRPNIAKIFAQDDAAAAMRSRSSSQSTALLSAAPSQSSLSNGNSTPISARPALPSTTPSYTPGVPAGSTTSDEPEEQILVPRTAERERPWSRLGEERARSRLGNETPKLPTLPTIEDRPKSRIGTEDRPRSRAFEDRQLGSESERERPASRLFRDGIDRPASRAGTLGPSASAATLGLGRPTGLARRFSTDLRPAAESMRVVSESGVLRDRTDSMGSMRERPESVLRKRSSIIFREQSDSVFREHERSATPQSVSSRNSGKRVGWVDTESPYVSAPLDTIYTPARPRSGLANNSVSESTSSDEDESDCAHRGSNALLVTPRRGLAAALGAEVYADDAAPNKGKASASMTKAQAQDLLRNIVSDVMFEFRQEAKEDVRGLHLDLLRASRGWKSDLKEYLGDTLEELRVVKEENFTMLKNESCVPICTATVPAKDSKFINDRIREDYAINWLVDGLPAAEMKEDERTKEIFYDMGFNLGDDEREEFKVNPALHNHYDIVLNYHTRDQANYRVVGVVVWPRSIAHSSASTLDCAAKTPRPLVLAEDKENSITYTYTIHWEESDTPWATRWDNYLHIFDPKIHWFSLINSLVIVIFLCVMVSMILVRTVSRDISRYNAIDLSEDVQEDFGWKLVHGEVFRSPRFPMVLSVLVGNGAQLCVMVGVTLIFALLGFLSPSNRGALATMMIVFWTFFGSIGGYVSARVYASIGGTSHAQNTFLTATVLPTFVFAVMFLLNLFLIGADSSGAVPLGTMLAIVALWFVISAPLSAIGSFFGKKHGPVSHPVRVNQIPRQIPPAPRYLQPWSASLLAGILPFGAAFVELYFVLSSLFASRAYYAFGFIALTAGVVLLTTATVTILFTYFMLCAEEYRWHWRAFMIGGGSAFWVLAYGVFYWLTRLSLDSFSSVVLYAGYLFLIALFDFLITGSIGFLATY
ncbi:unnamed protein product [Rhizoctonia solani]|nr:unnamed protein product [Rhizoctonia solani]